MKNPWAMVRAFGPDALGYLAFALVCSASATAQSSADWHSFEGSWSATGTRQSVPTEKGRAAIVHLSGAVVLSSGPAGGFTGEAIGLDDGDGTAGGRAVWTDSHGDRIFSRLRGGPFESARRISGEITGGTGKWTDATGEYSMTWQYLVAGEGDTVQGRTADLHGRIRAFARRP